MKASDSATLIYLSVVVLLLLQVSVPSSPTEMNSRSNLQPLAETAPALDARLVRVEGGTFQMGDVWGDGNLAIEETPVHEVEVGDFLLGSNEVTVAEYRKFVEATGYKTKGETEPPRVRLKPEEIRAGKIESPNWKSHYYQQEGNDPVVFLAWPDAMAYCNWLSSQEKLPPAYNEMTGHFLNANGSPTTNVREIAGFRLPTEAEWEFAARERGRKVRFGNGQDIARPGEMNFDAAGTGAMIPSLRLPASDRNPYNEPGATRGRTSPVGSFRPNALGLYDMSGNAWEWCLDTTARYVSEKQVDPFSANGDSHVLRGGNFDTDAKACRVSARIDWGGTSRCHASGFRVARTVN